MNIGGAGKKPLRRKMLLRRSRTILDDMKLDRAEKELEPTRTVPVLNDASGAEGAAAPAEEKAGEYALKSQLTVLEQRSDGLSLSVSELRRQTDTKAEQSQLTELTEHFRFGADGLTITNTATGMGISLSERQVVFTGGNDPTTVITPNAMQTTNLHIETRLDVGGFSLIPRSNQNLSLRYTAQ